jgi:hypothetical protein
MKRAVLGLAALALLCGAEPCLAGPSLWIGTDNISTRNVLNTDLAGNVLQTVGPLEATGFAIDLHNNIIYFGHSLGVITPRNLSNPNVIVGAPFTPDFNPPGLGEDMEFLNGSIWRTNSLGTVTQIDPATGHVLSSFNVGFEALGITTFGNDLLISNDVTRGVLEYTTAGTLVPGGVNFIVHDENGQLPREVGGLALDTTDNTLFIGQYGEVLHYRLDGTLIGHFAIPANQDPSRFVDGLGFSPAVVPEPASLTAAVLGMVAFSLVYAGRRPARAYIARAGIS